MNRSSKKISTRKNRKGLCFAAVVLGLASPASVRALPEFRLLGDLPGGSEYSVASGVSADGTYVVGASSSTNSGIQSEFLKPGEAYIWDATRGMVGLGDLPAGAFNSGASGVSADGSIAIGYGTEGALGNPFIWRRIGGMQRIGPADWGGSAGARAISADGSRVVGTVTWVDPLCFIGQCLHTQGFYWLTSSPPGSVTRLELETFNIAVARNGMMAGTEVNGLCRWDGSGVRQTIGLYNFGGPFPNGISADGRTIAGSIVQSHLGVLTTDTIVWREGRTPAFQIFGIDSGGAVGVSGDGRVVADRNGGLYIDDVGPYSLREILADNGVIDLLGLPAADFRVNALSENGLACVGVLVQGGITKAWRVKLTDCDGNKLPDELERLGFAGDASRLIAEGSQRFAASRDTLGYGDMISHYGKPWKAGSNRVPMSDPAQPAEYLRSVLRLEGCIDGGVIDNEQVAERFLIGAAFPAVQELDSFEMLLGNEALADAIDPTIGFDNSPPDDLSDQFAFENAAGIDDLLDEELALLRGRELPGQPDDWVKEKDYYPEYTGLGGSVVRAAVYNRLPPNADGSSGAAYKTSYKVTSNYEAALKFPQGHGDAYGHYLSALKAGIGFLRDGPVGWPEDLLGIIAGLVETDDAALQTVRKMAESAAARAQSAAQVTELTYRRDYREDATDPHQIELFGDADTERAWGMGDWARRGAIGAYLDWAVVSYWTPSDEARPVNRTQLSELAEIADSVPAFQSRMDNAGAGLDPLGLLQNVVPFGLAANGLGTEEERSHFDQVHDAASRAVDNARKAFAVANESNQRLRSSDKELRDFTNQIEDTKADQAQQMIEVFGLASPDDPRDNDQDPATNDFEESRSAPDLTNFLTTDEAFAAEGMRPRTAPGQVQLALSELRVASLRVEQAELAVDDLAEQIRAQTQRIAAIISVQLDRVKIIGKALNDQIDLTRRLEQLENQKKEAAMIGALFKGLLAGAVTGDPAAAIDAAGLIITEVAGSILAEVGEGSSTYDIEIERQRVETWKQLELQGLEDKLAIAAEREQLKSLIRRSPQLLMDVAAAKEVAAQALGRLHQSITRGKLALQARQRLVTRTEGQQLEERWKDMSFRVFRNAALKNYRAFFDIAARYVVLAARAYAYEFAARADGTAALAGIYRERRIGGSEGNFGGLQGVLTRLENAAAVRKTNRPIQVFTELQCSFRTNLLGISGQDLDGDRKFRAWLESLIVDRMEDIPEVRELAQISIENDYGPAIVIPFSTDINGRNIFGRGPQLPYGSTNFTLASNPKLVKYGVRLFGASPTVGTDPNTGALTIYLLPAGDSVLREQTNSRVIEDGPIQHWAVVDQYLPVPSVAATGDFSRRAYNPWSSNAQAGGNFLNEIKRQNESVAQIELGQSEQQGNAIYSTQLAGRSIWNTRWILIIPGRRWAQGESPEVVRSKLLELIYGPRPEDGVGIIDIYLLLRAYTR